MKTLRLCLLLAACGFPLSAAETNFILIPYGHGTVVTQWWTNTPPITGYVTNWQAWQASAENWRRASNALSTGHWGEYPIQ